MSAGTSSACLAHTQATAVIRTIPNPDQMAYTIPVGIVRSGKERSQNAATKQTTDMMLGTSLVALRSRQRDRGDRFGEDRPSQTQIGGDRAHHVPRGPSEWQCTGDEVYLNTRIKQTRDQGRAELSVRPLGN